MEIAEAREKLEVCEKLLDEEILVEFATFDVGAQKLQLYLRYKCHSGCIPSYEIAWYSSKSW